MERVSNMGYYDKNLQHLVRFSPVLHKIVAEGQNVYEGETTLLASEKNAVVKNTKGQCYLHSCYDQQRELQQMFADVKDDVEVIILFGLGFGVAVPYIAKKFPLLERLIVVEPNLEVFRAFLDEVDLVNFFSDFHKVSFIVNQSEDDTNLLISDLISHEQYARMEAVASISYRTLYSEYYQIVYRKMIDQIRNLVVNIVTRHNHTQRWLINSWRNRRKQGTPFECFVEQTPKWPAIIVSAGPSLNKNIHLLKEAKKRAVIIAVGSAISTLEANGITPHFRMAIDLNEDNLALFANVDMAACPLIYSESFYHETLAAYQGPTIEVVLNSSWLTQYFRKKQKEKILIIQSGFSVANVAFDLACQWGCPKIILMGQDLCYTDDKLHAEGTWDDENPYRKVNRQTMLKVQDIYGNDVYTDKPFLGMKNLFEGLVKQYADPQFWNATEGGLPITGIPNKPLQQILDDELTEVIDVKNYITTIIDLNHPVINKNHEENVQNIADELKTGQEILEKCLVQLKKVGGSSRKENPDKVLYKLKKVENKIKKVQQMEFFNNVLLRYVVDALMIAQRRGEYYGTNPEIRIKRKRQCLLSQIAIITEVFDWTGALVREYKGEQALTVIYQ